MEDRKNRQPTEHKQESGAIGLSGRLQAEHIRDNKHIGYRERDDRGVSADADIAGSTASQTVARPPSHNEDDTRRACQVLVEALRALGEDWANLEEGQGAVDCVARHRVAERTLEIQVVRADVSPEAWRAFSGGRTYVPGPADVDSLADTLKAAILHKTDPGPRALAPSSRISLVLALNALSLPRLAFDDVVPSFRSRFGTWCRGLGFSAVWLVGPTQTMTHRLDLE